MEGITYAANNGAFSAVCELVGSVVDYALMRRTDNGMHFPVTMAELECCFTRID
jgi:hypothetical protein